MPGPGQRVKYPRGPRSFMKKLKGMKKIARSKSKKPETGPSGKPPWGGSKGGRVGKSSGGPAVTKVKLPTGITHTGTGKFLGTPIKPKPKPKKERGYGQASEGRTKKFSGGSVSSRLSKAGPVAKPN